MDVFQMIGDFLHLIAVLMLLLKILANKNVIGLSYKTQEIYLIVFLTRYSDAILEHHWGSLYFNVMRLFFVSITAYTIYVMKFKRPYKMVLLLECRVTIIKRIPFRIGHCTSCRQSWPFSSTNPSLYMGSFGRFRNGFRRQQSCPSYI